MANIRLTISKKTGELKVLTRDIQIRDPFVVPVIEQGKYYMFGSTDTNIWEGPGTGFDCYASENLKDWCGPIPVFRPDNSFWGKKNFWAPEVYCYRDRWYMFATFTSESGGRGTQILVSDSITGPFVPFSDKYVTPEKWQSLDGTLFIDDDGKPWMVFCHEWTQTEDGEICAIRLTEL